MPSLTETQRNELHQSLEEYFQSHGFTNTLAAFRKDLSEKKEYSAQDTKIERKWFVNLRLQQRVLQLEKEIAELQENPSGGSFTGSVESGGSKDKRDGATATVTLEASKATLAGHRETVSSVRFHPTYSLVASGSEDCSVQLWDCDTGEHERTLRGHTGIVTCVDFDPAGKILASSSGDMTIKLWNFTSGECLRTLVGHDHTVSAIQFIPSLSPSSSSDAVSAPSGAAPQQSDLLVSCSRDCSIRIWDTQTGFCKKVLMGHTDWVRTIAVSVDGSLIASGGTDQSIRLWSSETGDCSQVLTELTHVIECLAFSNPEADRLSMALFPVGPEPDKTASSSTIASAAASDLTSGSVSASTPLTTKPRLLLSGSRDKEIRGWDVLTGSVLFTLKGHDDWVRSICFHRGGRYILSCGDDWTIRLWDLETQRCRKKIAEAHGHFVTSLALHPKKPLLASGSVDKTIKLWPCK